VNSPHTCYEEHSERPINSPYIFFARNPLLWCRMKWQCSSHHLQKPRQAAGRTGTLTGKPMNRVDAWRMIQRRAAELGMRIRIGCHTFRATGITAYLEAGGTLENAQAMAAHESPRTTKLYDRTGDEITLDEIERISI
jgi:integrase